jgi:hypothetical protein
MPLVAPTKTATKPAGRAVEILELDAATADKVTMAGLERVL